MNLKLNTEPEPPVIPCEFEYHANSLLIAISPESIARLLIDRYESASSAGSTVIPGKSVTYPNVL